MKKLIDGVASVKFSPLSVQGYCSLRGLLPGLRVHFCQPIFDRGLRPILTNNQKGEAPTNLNEEWSFRRHFRVSGDCGNSGEKRLRNAGKLRSRLTTEKPYIFFFLTCLLVVGNFRNIVSVFRSLRLEREV